MVEMIGIEPTTSSLRMCLEQIWPSTPINKQEQISKNFQQLTCHILFSSVYLRLSKWMISGFRADLRREIVKAKICNKTLATLTPQPRPYQIHDTEMRRFFVRVQPSGVMIYYCNVTFPNGKRTARKIGLHGHLTPAQAREEAKKILGDVARGIDPDAAKHMARALTLKEYIASKYGPWLKARQKRGDERGDARAEKRASQYLKMIETSFPDLLNKKLFEITPWLIEKWKMAKLNSGLKPASVNRKMDSLRAALTKAVKWGLLEKNPFSSVEWCELDDNAIVRFLSDDEAQRLEQAMSERDERIRAGRRKANEWRKERNYELFPDLDSVSFVDHVNPIIVLSRNTGARRSELFNVEAKHVDLQGRVLTVAGDTSKNGKTRHIPLNNTAFEVLSKWISQNKITTGYVFPGENGEPLDNINKAWRKLLEDAKIENFRWHDMRHDFASRLVMSRVDLNTVRDLLGHADLKMTLRYAHLAPKVKADAVSTLDTFTARVVPLKVHVLKKSENLFS